MEHSPLSLPTLPKPCDLEFLPGPRVGSCLSVRPHFSSGWEPEIVARLQAHLGRRALMEAGVGTAFGLAIERGPEGESEGFELWLQSDGLRLTAGGEAGLHAGVETLAQLLRTPGALPALRWRDTPRFAWRGVMLDCARHAWPASRLHALLDELAAGRGNRLHLHLTDDQGWSLPLPGSPDLAALSSRLRLQELREVVAHGRELGVAVLPEVDLPGHCGALLEARPELACPGRGGPRPRAWGCHEALLCLGNPALPEFVDELLDGLRALFPFGWVHLGGDEVPAQVWESCPRCRERLRREGMQSGKELPAWWLRLLESRLTAHGLRGAYWDEALDSGPAADSLLFAWRGEAAVQRCLEAGFATVACPQRPCYLDHYPGREAGAPRAIGGWNPWQALRAFDPAGGRAQPAHLLGGQANLWTEYVDSEELLMERLQPRLAALLESLWTGAESAAEFPSRLPALLGEQVARGWQPRLDPPRVEGAPLALTGRSLQIHVSRSLPEAELELRTGDSAPWQPIQAGAQSWPDPGGGVRRVALRQRLGRLSSRPVEMHLRWENAWPSCERKAGAQPHVEARWLLAPEPDWRRVAPDPAESPFFLETLEWPREAVARRWSDAVPACPTPAEPWRRETATPALPPLAPWGPVRGLSRRAWIVIPEPGVWRFRLESHSLARLWVDGILLLDHDGFTPAGWLTGWAPLAAGPHELRLDWLDLRGGGCRLEGPERADEDY
jgi:hexosaminidase